MMMRGRLTALGLAACIAGGCVGLIGDTDERGSEVLGSATGTPVEPMMVRLTAPQMHNTYVALLGEPLALPDLPQDDQLYGLSSISAATKTVAPIEAEKYEAAAYFVLDQIWADPPRLEALVGCAPNIDDPCARAFLTDFGKRAWRRPLSDAELDELVALGSDIANRLDDASQGLRFALAAILQSPHFVFRVAIGEPDESGLLRFTSWEMASRLSYLIVDGPPDDALMEAAEAGILLDPAALRAEARRLVDSPAARPALVRFFRDFMNIGRLHQLDKDLDLFPTFTATLGPSMQLEIERMFENVVFEKEGDFRQLFTTRDTYLNEELAAIYGIEGIEGPDFVPVTLPDDGTRAGLLTTPGFLAMNAHKTQTSPTHRGRFVRISLLCEDVPPPPPGVDTTLPENAGADKTMRERLSVHSDDPACSSCHLKMDPIGFGLEHYDPIGAWRDLDNGLPIDAAADLDGAPFEGGVELAHLVAELPAVGSCIARRFYQHATTHLDGPKEQALVDGVIASFVAGDYDFKTLVVEMVASGGFRYATAPATEDK
jgi:hypothetical protein